VVKRQLKNNNLRKRNNIQNFFLRILLGTVVFIILLGAIFSTFFLLPKDKRNEITQELTRRAAVAVLEDYFYGDITVKSAFLNIDTGILTATDIRLKLEGDTKRAIEVPKAEIHLNFNNLKNTPKKYLRALDKIVLHNAKVNVVMDEDGNLNIARLLRPQPKSTVESYFVPMIIVQNGTVDYTDYSKKIHDTVIHERLKNFFLTVQLGGDYLPFSLRADIDKKPLIPLDNLISPIITNAELNTTNIFVSGGIIIKDLERIDIKVEIDSLNGRRLLEYLPKNLPMGAKIRNLDVQNGELHLTVNKIEQKYDTDLFFEADLNNLDAEIMVSNNNINIQNFSSRIAFDGKNFTAKGFTAFVNGLLVSGSIGVSDISDPVVAIEILADNADAAKIAGLFPNILNGYHISGKIAHLSSYITYANKILTVHGDVKNFFDAKADIFNGTLLLNNLDLKYSYANKMLSVKDVKISLRDSYPRNISTAFSPISPTSNTITGAGYIRISIDNFNSARGVFNLTAHNATFSGMKSTFHNMGQMSETLTGIDDFDATISGDFIGNITGQNKVTIIGVPKGHITAAEIPFINADYTAAFKAVLGPNEPYAVIDIPTSAIRNPHYSANLSVGIVNGKINGNFDVYALNLEMLKSFIPTKKLQKQFQNINIAGNAYLKGSLNGTTDDIKLDSYFRVKNGQIGDLNNLIINAKVTGEMLSGKKTDFQASDIYISSPNNMLELSASDARVIYHTGNENPLSEFKISGLKISPLTVQALKDLLGVDLPINGFIMSDISYIDSIDNFGGVITINLPSIIIGETVRKFESLKIDFTINELNKIIINEAVLNLGGAYLNPTIKMNGTISKNNIILYIISNNLPLESIINYAPNSDIMLSSDGHLNLPINIEGSINFNAELKLKPTSFNILNTLTISGNFSANDDLSVAGLNYRELYADFLYNLGKKELRIISGALSRGIEGSDYRFSIDDSLISFTDKEKTSVNVIFSGIDGGRFANLRDVRNDLDKIIDNLNKIYAYDYQFDSNMKRIVNILTKNINAIPINMGGLLHLDAKVTGEVIGEPVIEVNIDGKELIVNNKNLPQIDINGIYDMAKKNIQVANFVMTGGDNPDFYMAVSPNSVVTFPSPSSPNGVLNFDIEVQNLDINYLSSYSWFESLSSIYGNIDLSVSTRSNSTFSSPKIDTTIDWSEPVVYGIPFDSFNAILQLDNDLDDPKQHRIYIGQRSLGALGDANLYLKDSLQNGDEPLRLSGYIPISTENGSLKISFDDDFSLAMNFPTQSVSAFSGYLPYRGDFIQSLNSGSVAGSVTIGGSINMPRFMDESYLRMAVPEISFKDISGGAVKGIKNVSSWIIFRSELNSENEIINRVVVRDMSADFETQNREQRKGLFERLKTAVGLGRKSKTYQNSTLYASGSMEIITPKDGWVYGKHKNLNDFFRYNLSAHLVNMPLNYNNGMIISNINGVVQLDNEPIENKPRLTGLVAANDTEMIYAAVNRNDDEDDGEKAPLPFNPLINIVLLFNGNNEFSFRIGSRGIFEAVSGVLPVNPSYMEYDNFLPADIQDFINDLKNDTSTDSSENESVRGSVTDDFEEDVVKIADNEFGPPIPPEYTIPGRISHSAENVAEERRNTIAEHALSLIFNRFSNEQVSHLTPEQQQNIIDEERKQHSAGVITGSLSDPILNIYYSLVPGQAKVKLPGGTLVAQNNPTISGEVSYDRVNNPEKPFNITAHGTARAIIPNYTLLLEINSTDLIRDLAYIDISGTVDNSTIRPSYIQPVKIYVMYSAPGAPVLSDSEFFYNLLGVGSFVEALNSSDVRDDTLRSTLVNIGLQSMLGDSFADIAELLYLDSISFILNPDLNIESTILTKELRVNDFLGFNLGASALFDREQSAKVWVEIHVPRPIYDPTSGYTGNEWIRSNEWIRNFSFTGEYGNYNGLNNPNGRFRYNLSLLYRWHFALNNWKVE